MYIIGIYLINIINNSSSNNSFSLKNCNDTKTFIKVLIPYERISSLEKIERQVNDFTVKH